MSDAEDKKVPGTEAAETAEKDLTDQLAKERDAKPGPGTLQSTASQVDDPASDKTPRPQTASPRQQPETAGGAAAGTTSQKTDDAAAHAETEKPAASAEKPAAGSGKSDAGAEEPAAAEAKPAAGGAKPAAGAAAARAGAAARADAARAAKAEEAKPPEPSPKQPWLDKLVETIQRRFGEGVVEEAAINRLSEDRPTLVVNPARWLELARFLKAEPELAFVYLNDIVGIDYGKYFEVVYHLVSIAHREHLTVKVRTDREGATVPSVVSVWPGADWPEREAYDLLGIRFDGHPDLRRIMLPENWVGHPLRKDYEQYDEII